MNDREYLNRWLKNEVSTLYHNILFSEQGKKGLDYILGRGISEDTLRQFNIGYAPEDSVVVNYLKDQNIDPSIAYECNLIKNTRNGQVVDYFSNHIIFPIFKDNTVASFTGRRAENIEGDHLRHIHLKNCSKYIYNGDTLKDSPYIFLVESPINCLTMSQWGYNTISVMGASSINAINPKDFYRKYIYILYDNDTNGAGQKAAIKTAIHFYENERLDTFILSMPNGKDVNDYAKTKDVSDFRKEIMPTKIKFTSTKEFKDWLAQKRAELRRPKFKYDKNTDRIEKANSIPILDVVKLYNQDITTFGNISKCKCFIGGHSEQEPSFTIFNGTNTVKCYGCGFFADNIKLVRHLNNLGFKEAIDFLIKTFYGE